MPAPLTPAFIDALVAETADMPVRPGATARIGWQVADAPSGAAELVLHLEDGRVVGGDVGAGATGGDPGADFTLVATHADHLAVLAGDLDAEVAFMQGRIKVVGDLGRMLSVLPVTRADAWRAATARAAA